VKGRSKESRALSPFSATQSIWFALGLWLIFALLVGVLEFHWGRPDAEVVRALVPVILLVGGIPLIFVLVEFIAKHRGKAGLGNLLTMDFTSAIVRAHAEFALAANIGDPAPVIPDLTTAITKPLSFGSGEPIARIDLGDEWWVTRLLVVCVRAVRTGRPEVLVFTGPDTGISGRFIGWARTVDLLDNLVKEMVIVNTQLVAIDATFGETKLTKSSGSVALSYDAIYKKAELITQALPALRWLAPHSPVPPTGPAWAELDGPVRYINRPDYANLGPDALEQVLLDQIGILQIETNNPDLLTIARLQDIAQNSLHRQAIDVSAPHKEQIDAFLSASEPYVGLTKGGVFQRLATTRELQQATFAWLVGTVGPSSDYQ
jgi:hypothetical protein